jgi:AraC-like DNA-binding protein
LSDSATCSRVRIIVMHYLSSKYCTREQVAESLKLHPRTMDRRLAEEGTAFLDIKTEVRRNTLIYYLAKTSLDFVTVSQRLGYSEQAVMSRNCRKWFGKTPRQIRLETR